MVNPARAGMIRPWALWKRSLLCKPRASGDDPTEASVEKTEGK